MKRNSILVFCLGALMSFALFAPGCGDDDSKKDGTDAGVDARKDTGAGGAIGTGGKLGSGGALGSGGLPGSGGAPGTGGVIGKDGSIDGPFVIPDSSVDGRDARDRDARDARDGKPIDVGPVFLDGAIDVVLDVSLDVPVDQSIDTTPGVDVASVDTGIDSAID